MNAPIAELFGPLLGHYETETWGEGICPTGATARFTEDFTLTAGDDWVRYEQRAVADDGATLHTETGVIRTLENTDELEIALVMNSGRIEIGRAHVDGAALRTTSTTFHNDRLGVTAISREFNFDASGCNKTLWLANGRWAELTRHTWARLERIDA